jgi:integrase
MARTLKDAKLDTREARRRLEKRREPHWRSISEGLAIGYRRGSKGGTWIARHYSPENGRRYLAIGTADDVADADDVHVLAFAEAQERARKWFADLAGQDGGISRNSAYTVADAMDDYLRFLESDGRSKHSVADARCRDQAFIRSELGKVKLAALTADRIRRWRDELVKTAPRVRSAKGKEQKYRKLSDDEDARRARRASANRTWTTLRSALNHAFRERKVSSDLAWRTIKPFRNVDSARIRYLKVAEAKRLINASDREFRPVVQAALATGARYGELIRLEAQDFNPDAGTLAIRKSKTGKAHHIVLTDEGMSLFRALTTGQRGQELILRKSNGEPFGMSHQNRPMLDACGRAKIKPRISFHGLRHTWASLAVMNGMPLMVVARNLGHADTRMVEKHYSHLAPSYIADAIRTAAPRFGIKADRKVVSIGTRA